MAESANDQVLYVDAYETLLGDFKLQRTPCRSTWTYRIRVPKRRWLLVTNGRRIVWMRRRGQWRVRLSRHRQWTDMGSGNGIRNRKRGELTDVWNGRRRSTATPLDQYDDVGASVPIDDDEPTRPSASSPILSRATYERIPRKRRRLGLVRNSSRWTVSVLRHLRYRHNLYVLAQACVSLERKLLPDGDTTLRSIVDAGGCRTHKWTVWTPIFGL